MPTARKLPSGSWRVRAFSYKDSSGKKHYESYTADTKKKAELLAAQHKGEKHGQADLTFRQALTDYIARREAILSPATVKEYKGMKDRHMQSLMEIKLSKITQEDIQKEVNLAALTLSPKTVKNIHGMITAVMSSYRPDFAIRTDLPKKIRPNIYVPSEADIQTLLQTIRGKKMELPVLLAAFGPMRRGEIAALRAENISGSIVHVCENMVRNENKEWVVKSPKSYAGDRYIAYPDFVAKHWEGITEGRIVPLTPQQITKGFICALHTARLPHFRFHDLRHFSVSIQHALGVGDAYLMQRGGWSSDATLKNVYRHVMEDQTQKMNDMANQYFAKKYDTKYDTKK